VINAQTNTRPPTYDTYVNAKYLRRNMQMGDKGFGYGSGFALIVVLFILLIIVGAAWLY
jgi:uncharacterized protein (TIGR01732 family)